MMNIIKYLLMVVLTVGAIGSALNVAAQSAVGILVTAGGKTLRQTDVDKVVKFYEWAFGAEFTAEQRERFQTMKVEEFRNDPANSKKGNDDMINLFSQIKTKSRSEQQELRRKFNASFVPDLRKGIDDEQAQLLVSIYDAANADENAAVNENVNGSGNGSYTMADADAIGDLSGVVGKWFWQNSGSGTWNSATGAYLGGSGTRTTYEFASNGAVTYTGIMNVMMGGCSQQTFLKQTGRASISGNQMTIKWAPGTSTRDFSCDKGGNYTKQAPAVTENFPISFKTNSTGQRLFCMNAGSSKETCFNRAE